MSENIHKSNELNEQELEAVSGGASITFRLQCPNCARVKLISDPNALVSADRCECGALMQPSGYIS